MDTEQALDSCSYSGLVAICDSNRSEANAILDYVARYSRFIRPKDREILHKQLVQLQRNANEALAQIVSYEQQAQELSLLECRRVSSLRKRVDKMHKTTRFYRTHEVLGGAPGLGRHG